MHEGAICKSLLDIAERSFLDSGLKQVSKVRVIIGRFHNVINEVLQMHFDLMKAEMPGFEHAVLEIEDRDLVIECRKCHQTAGIDDISFTCSRCGSTDTELIQGNELHIDFIEGTDNTE